MINAKAHVRNILTGDAPLIALVPATRILASWPDSFVNLPMINYREIDSFTTDAALFDDMPIADNSTVEIQIWNKPGASCTAIFEAVNRIMEANRWNRDFAEDFTDPETKMSRKVARYSAVLYR
jgi:hypothetical protein